MHVIIKYLHQNGKVCTLVRIANGDDVEIMFLVSAGDASVVYLYIQTSTVNEIDHHGNEHRNAIIGLVIFNIKS